MTTQSDDEGSVSHDTAPGDGSQGEAEVDRRPDTVGYPSAEDAGSALADDATVPTDDRDRAGYPDATDASEPD
jgi:hypothetical protein